MKRVPFYLKLSLGALSVLFGFQNVIASERPNILCIIADDLRAELGCYGAEHIHSPNIDSIAAGGTLFTRAYAQKALCGPSRASFFSGARPDTTKVHGNRNHFREALPDIRSLPQFFKDYGYFTAGFGKILHNGMTDPPSWSQPKYSPYQPIYAAPENAGKAPVINKVDPANKENPLFEAAHVEEAGYRDGLFAEEAIETLRNRPKDRPFFMMVGFHKPHTPFNAPKKYWDLYDREKIALADNQFVPMDCPKQFAWAPGNYVRSFAGLPESGPIPDALQREIKHAYQACISYIDALTGQILDELENQGESHKTVIVFWSDHGYQLGEHDMWCKHSNFETSTHVPLMIVDPRKESKGVRCDSFAELVDIYPTLADLVNLPRPHHLEGDVGSPGTELEFAL